MRHPFVQAIVLIVAASVIAVVANGFAGRTRKLVLKGFYPNALRVPPRTPEQVPPPVAAAPTTTMQSPAPGAAPVPVPTATIERPAVTATTATVAVTTTTPAMTATAAPVPAATKPPAPAPAENVAARFQPHPDKAYVELGGEDVVALYKSGALFLDARRTSVYEQGHIAGARSFSVWESDVDDKVNALFGERSDPRDQNLPIVIYCSGGACEDSHMLAQKLWGVQFNNVYVYKDGYPDWEKRNGATRTGGQP